MRLADDDIHTLANLSEKINQIGDLLIRSPTRCGVPPLRAALAEPGAAQSAASCWSISQLPGSGLRTARTGLRRALHRDRATGRARCGHDWSRGARATCAVQP